MKENDQTDLLDDKTVANRVEDMVDTSDDKMEETQQPQPTSDNNHAQQEVVTDDSAHSTALIPQEEDEDGELQIGSVRFRGNLLLHHEESATVFRVENANLAEAVIGRFDKRTGYEPTIDLSALEENNLSVSRRHATINLRGQLIFVTDHNSLNGTFLNGHRLPPEQARVVRDSDSLRIGNLNLLVSFEDNKS